MKRVKSNLLWPLSLAGVFIVSIGLWMWAAQRNSSWAAKRDMKWATQNIEKAKMAQSEARSVATPHSVVAQATEIAASGKSERAQRYEARLKLPKGAKRQYFLDTIDRYTEKDDLEKVKKLKEELAAYDAMTPKQKANADTRNMIGRKALLRSSKAYHQAIQDSLTDAQAWQRYIENRPDSYATTNEKKAQDALSQIEHGPRSVKARHFRAVARWMSDERRRSLDALEKGNPEDPHWHADRVEFIEESAQLIGIELDAENEDWIAESIAEVRRPIELAAEIRNRESKESFQRLIESFYTDAD